MEFYGSIDSVSGSITASVFTGSFKGDGGNLYNIQASGVTGLNLSQIASGNATASISSTGFTVNKNTQIQGDLSVTGSIIATNYIVSSSVTYMTTSFASGSTAFGDGPTDIHQFSGSVKIEGNLSLNGTAVGTGKLDETTFQSYTSSISSSIGSLSSSIALTDVSQSNRLTTIEGNYATTGSNLFKGSQTISGSITPSVDNTYDLGSPTYQWRDVYISSGSLYIDGTKVLGSTSQELTITTDTGQSIKILEAGSDSIILQSADGDIELKSSGGGDILFDPTSGLISIKGTTQIQDGFKITSSGGTNIVFGDSVIVSGSIELTGNVDGIDLQSFSSSVSASISSLLGGNTSLSSSIATTTSGLSSSINSLSSSVATTTSGLTSTITSVSSSLTSSIGSLSSSLATTTSGLSSSIGSLSSSIATTTSGLSSSIATTTSELSSSIATTTLGTKNRVDSIETTTGSLNTFSSSINTIIKSKLDSESVISGSIQVIITGTTGYSTFSSSVSTSIDALSSSVATTTSGLSSSVGSLSSSAATTTSGLSSSIGNLSSSIATTTSGLSSSIGSLSSSVATTTGTLSSSIATTTLGTKNRVDSIESKTGSYATTGSNIFQGDQTITGSLYVSQNLIIAGSSSIQNISSSVLNIADNIITVNAINPSVRFGGLAVIDSGSSPQVSGSMLFDSVNNQWLFVHQNQGTVTSSVLLMGPETYNNLGNETYITSNRLVKSTGIEHLTNSNISDDGTTVTMLSNTIVNGTFSATGTTLVSGSSQINHNTTTNYDANQHVDHTSVSITAGSGLSGGGTIASTRTITLDTGSVHFLDGVKKELNTEGVVSGSSQITYSGLSGIPSGIVSGSSQVLAGTTIHSGAFFNGISVVSGSAQISFGGITGVPSGLVSGSSQVSYTGLSSIPSGIVSGSAQLTSTFVQKSGDTMTGALTAPGITSTDGLTVSGTGYYTFNKPSTTNYQTVALFGSTTNGIFITSDSGIISRGAFFNGGWQATSTTGAYLNFNTSGGGMDLNVFSGATIGGAATFTSLFTVARDNFSFNGNAIYHAGNLTNLNQLTNGPGYITSYTETDTLSTVVARGSSTSSSITTGGLIISAVDVDVRVNRGRFQVWNNAGTGNLGYRIRTDENGGWRWQFVDGGNVEYFGVAYSTGNATILGTISASNFSGTSSGTNTGDQTTVSGNAGTVTNGVYTTGDQTIGGAKTFSSRVSVNGTLAVNTSNDSSTSTGGITFWDAGNTTTSWIGFKNASNSGWGTHGGASATYHTYFVMDTASRGWIFRYASPGGTDFSGTNVASISNTGRFAANNGYQFTFNGTNRGGIYAKTTWFGSGSDYSPSICAEGGLNFNVYVDGSTTKGTTIDTSGHLYPVGNGTQNLGGTSNRWATVYTSDLSLNNGIGDYTIVEGEEKLYLYNNKNNKVYSFVLQEEDPITATPKKS